MREFFYLIRKSYYAALVPNPALVPVYDAVPANAAYPYILLSQQNAVPLECSNYETSILIEIITGYTGIQGGKKDADLIADMIYILLTPPLIIEAGFQIGKTTLESDFDQGREITETMTINRRLIRFSNYLTIL